MDPEYWKPIWEKIQKRSKKVLETSDTTWTSPDKTFKSTSYFNNEAAIRVEDPLGGLYSWWITGWFCFVGGNKYLKGVTEEGYVAVVMLLIRGLTLLWRMLSATLSLCLQGNLKQLSIDLALLTLKRLPCPGTVTHANHMPHRQLSLATDSIKEGRAWNHQGWTRPKQVLTAEWFSGRVAWPFPNLLFGGNR